MAQDTIRFRRIETDSEIVAVAEVPLFRGVYLRGWNILKRGDEIEVVPPFKVYRDPDSGEKRILPLLAFESEETRQKWVGKVKEEYLKWEKGETIASPVQPQMDRDVKAWDQEKKNDEGKGDIS